MNRVNNSYNLFMLLRRDRVHHHGKTNKDAML